MTPPAPSAPSPAAPASTTGPAPQIAEPTDDAYHTDYHFHLLGGFRPRGHLLIINHTIRIRLQLSEFMLLFVLACHARTRAKLDAPMAVPGGMFMLPDRIVKVIRKIKAGEVGLGGQLEDLNEGTMYGAKLRVRKRLKKERLLEDLLEAVLNSGYRISTRPEWIKITLFDDEEGNETWA